MPDPSGSNDPAPAAKESGEGPSPGAPHAHANGRLGLLALGALGVVYGDIGTSPLYAMKECFSGVHGVTPTHDNIYGVLSLLTWSLILIISVKYLAFILRADNRGEGGELALMALALRSTKAGKRQRAVVIMVGLFGAALLYGDGVITPAISVLGAVEGLTVATTVFNDYVQWIAIAIMVVLFAIQRRGTGKIGSLFGPIMLVWFLSIGTLGALSVVQNPSVLLAVNPLYGVEFFLRNGWHGFLVLGAVFLVVTGGEALYADMGHFGRKPIQLAWFGCALPGLLLNYYGQAALLITNPAAAENPFYRLVTHLFGGGVGADGERLPATLLSNVALYGMVVLATMAAIIASQALISGAFSLTRQAVQLGYSPRFEIIHTSAQAIGQIYIPGLNWLLLVGVIFLVVGFGSSSALAAAYGVGVSMTMVITTFLFYFVARNRWGWGRAVTLTLCSVLLAVELSFFGANALKFMDGGWFPFVVGLSVFTLMTTWKKGRTILAERLRNQVFPLDLFLSNVGSNPPLRVPGVAVFMTGNPEGTPPALMHNLKHNKVLHQRVVLLTVETPEVPHVPPEERAIIEPLEHGIYRVIARYGFVEQPDVPALLTLLREKGLELRMMETTFFLGRETLIPTRKPGMALWREAIFAWMSRNAHPANAYFNLPPNRVVELGAQVEL